MAFKIYPLCTGYIKCDKTVLTQGIGCGKRILIPSLAWYIEGDKGEKLLVDTGMCNSERADKYHYSGSFQKANQRVDKVLQKKGVESQGIKHVIFTHLHWDHCQNLGLFNNAQFYVQKKELNFALNPLPPYYNSYESTEIGLKPPFIDAKFRLLNGEKRIVPGIKVFPTPGHSPGHQSVAVKTDLGCFVIAGDAVLCWENIKGDETRNLPFIMLGRYMDLEQTWHSLQKIKEVADFVLPGHEREVLKKKCYP